MTFYFSTDVIPVGFADFGVGTGVIYLSNVGCDGSEMELDECSGPEPGQNYCSHLRDAGVICQGRHGTGGRQPCL